MELRCGADLLDAMLADTRARHPREACGLVLGHRRGTVWLALGYHPCPNRSRRPESGFRIAPLEFLAAARSARDQGLEILGSFHSHPSGEPRPSPRDCADRAGLGTLWIAAFGTAGASVGVWRDRHGLPLVPLRLRIEPSAVPHRDR
jgi:proteasome lid subunit RPN8/RPN11